METKKILLIIGSVLGLFIFLFVAYSLTSKPEQTYFENLTKVASTDHTKWSKNNKIILTEYSDFQCPACASYFDLLKGLDETSPDNKKIFDNVTFVYRNFPLDQIHPNAREAAYAAEAAAKQNAFFPYHDILFSRQSEWAEMGDPSEMFIKYAEELKLDVDQFKKDFASDTVKQQVQSDYLSGTENDVQGTPTFYLNGYKIRSPQSVEELRQVLLDAIEQSKTS